MNSSANWIVGLAGLLGGTGVGLGALGAHALQVTLVNQGTLETWRTAALYQMLHAVALLAVGAGRAGIPRAGAIGVCWAIGIVCFSGSLFGLALGGPRWLGPVTPVGGVFLLVGWALLIWSGFSRRTA